MTTWHQNHERRQRTPALGQRMSLDERTPLSLFEARNGDRFIVSKDPEYGRFAIVLRSSRYPLFSWHSLSRKPWMKGRWWGPYRIRLTESCESEDRYEAVGTIFVMDRAVGIECMVGEQQRSMPLGVTAEASRDAREAEGWTIEAIRAGFTFCERSTSGRINCAPAPDGVITCWNQDDFIEIASPWA